MRTIHTLIFAMILVAAPSAASAFIPILVGDAGMPVAVTGEASAYYGVLNGEPHQYVLTVSEPFPLTLSLWVPDVETAKRDVSLAVIQDGNEVTPLTVFDTNTATWELVYDAAAENFYRNHSTFKAVVPPGAYDIRVWSSNNDSAYVLRIGEENGFQIRKILGGYTVLPQVKGLFFGEPAWHAYVSPALVGPIFLLIVILGLGSAVWYLWRSR